MRRPAAASNSSIRTYDPLASRIAAITGSGISEPLTRVAVPNPLITGTTPSASYIYPPSDFDELHPKNASVGQIRSGRSAGWCTPAAPLTLCGLAATTN